MVMRLGVWKARATNASMTSAGHTHTASRLIRATPEAITLAFINPDALVRWLPPKGAAGRIDVFEPVVGGRLRMTLVFDGGHGKSSENTDVVEARFADIAPGEHIALSVAFVSDDPRFAGTMIMTWRFQPGSEGTTVTVAADHVPVGIGQTEHEAAMASTLANLAEAVEIG